MPLTVVLPAKDEQQRLPMQLGAILRQSRPPDSLILRDDGSTDNTQAIMRQMMAEHMTPDSRIDWHIIIKDRPSGINRAFNESAKQATGDWLYLASANDQLLPGAFAAWDKAVTTFPDARIAAGCPHGHYLGWLPKMGFMTPEMLRPCLRRQFIHGCGTFIRRDAWEEYGGYREDLGSLADFFLYNVVSLREGMIYSPEPIARSSSREIPSGHEDAHEVEKKQAIIARIEAMLNSEFVDVKEPFLAAMRSAGAMLVAARP